MHHFTFPHPTPLGTGAFGGGGRGRGGPPHTTVTEGRQTGQSPGSLSEERWGVFHASALALGRLAPSLLLWCSSAFFLGLVVPCACDLRSTPGSCSIQGRGTLVLSRVLVELCVMMRFELTQYLARAHRVLAVHGPVLRLEMFLKTEACEASLSWTLSFMCAAFSAQPKQSRGTLRASAV